jgi:pimeloyl-ACP methyl ester carboxylesterase
VNDAAGTSARYRDGYFTVSDGLKLHYRDYPGTSGRPPLLCLHGLTRNARDFEQFAERYSPEFRVIVLEFRGRGLSDLDPIPTRYQPLTYAGDVLQLLDHLGLSRAIFVGTSLGGLVTMGVAGIAPQRIAAAILNDIGPELGQVGLDRIQKYLGTDAHFRTWEDAADAISVSQGPSFPNYTTEDWLRMARRNCRERDGEIIFDYDMSIAEPFRTGSPVPKFDMWPLFEALAQKPLLIIRGEISELLLSDAFEKMRQAAPNAHFAVVAQTGHAPELSEPEALAAIDRFLEGLKQAG